MENPAMIHVSRSAYDLQDLYSEMNYVKPPPKSKKCRIGISSVKSFLVKTFPIFSWLYSYKKDYLIEDFISGCSVAMFHLPGMGHALLANLPPVVGIYMAFFPVLAYVIFGSSRHNSMGTFAVLAIMVEKSVNKYSNYHHSSSNGGNSTIDASNNFIDYGYSPIEVATLISFLVGAIQLTMYALRLGVLSFLLSESLVSGLTCGAAFHIFSAQVKDLVGIVIPPVEPSFKLIKTYIEIFKKIDKVNYMTLLISVGTIVIMVVNNELLKPRMAKKTKFPIPMELIVILVGALIAKFVDLEDTYNVIPVGFIPTGLPGPILPKFDLWKELLVDAFAIAVVSYSVSISLALIFAQKMNYEIDFNQELLAMGSANIVGSFFACFPVSAALARSVIQQLLGGKTQLASIVSAMIICSVLLWIGSFFEILPRSILAAVIIVSLKGLLMKVFDFSRFKKRSKIDAAIWAITFLTVVIVAIDIGLLVGIVLSVLSILYTSLKPHIFILGHVPNTDFYLNAEKFEKSIEIPHIKMFHYGGSLNFATKTMFKNRLCKKLGINLVQELKKAKNIQNGNGKQKQIISNWNFHYLIIDFSALTYIDTSSISALTVIIKNFADLNIKIAIAGCSSKIYDALIKNEFSFMDLLYPTIHDAVQNCDVSKYLTL